MKKRHKIFYSTLRFLFKPILMLVFRPKIVNRNLIPKEGAVIFCGNHRSFYDQFMAIAAERRPISFLAKSEYFDNKLIAWFFKGVGCIRTDRDKKGGDALEEALKVLKKGDPVGIFPEGTRNRTDKPLIPFKFGAVSLAKKTDAWIVPFGITGSYHITNKDLRVEFAKPFKVGDMTLEEANQKLYNTILEIIIKE